MVRKTETSLGNQSLKQKAIDDFLQLYKQGTYYWLKNLVEEYIENPNIDFIDADVIHNLVSGDGISPVVGIVLRQLQKERKIKLSGYKNSERKICHHRRIGIFEVIHDDICI